MRIEKALLMSGFLGAFLFVAEASLFAESGYANARSTPAALRSSSSVIIKGKKTQIPQELLGTYKLEACNSPSVLNQAEKIQVSEDFDGIQITASFKSNGQPREAVAASIHFLGKTQVNKAENWTTSSNWHNGKLTFLMKDDSYRQQIDFGFKDRSKARMFFSVKESGKCDSKDISCQEHRYSSLYPYFATETKNGKYMPKSCIFQKTSDRIQSLSAN